MVTKIIMGLLLKLLLDQACLFKMYSEIKRKKDKKPFVIRQLRLEKIGILSYFLFESVRSLRTAPVSSYVVSRLDFEHHMNCNICYKKNIYKTVSLHRIEKIDILSL